VAEPFLGEIRIMSFNFAPKGWVLAAPAGLEALAMINRA
jgi:microcystin-dependent protein